jgi:hypothetical protein
LSEALYILGLLISMGFDQEKRTPLNEDNNACSDSSVNGVTIRERATFESTSRMKSFRMDTSL